MYEEYKAKLAKRGNVLKKIWRFKIPILSSFLAILATAITLMSIKGLVIDDVTIKDTVYGEKLEYSSHAIFNSTSYEFYDEKNATWSNAEPILVGNYKARAVSYSIFGNVRYGETYTFNITPKNIDVSFSEEKILYGTSPTAVANLAYNDKILKCLFNTYNYNSTGAMMMAMSDSIKIIDNNNKDVTDCYTFNTLEKGILFDKRNLSILSSNEKEYDGTPLSATEFSITSGTLADNDTLYLDKIMEVTDVGVYGNASAYKVLHNNSIDVTDYYNINTNGSLLTVTERKLSIETLSSSFEYDDNYHSYPRYSILSGSLIGGDKLVPTFASHRYAGEYNNDASFKVVNGSNKDVTNNYNISLTYGKLKITQKALSITTSSKDKVYDATPLFSLDYKISKGSLIKGHKLIVNTYPSATDVSSIKNNLTFKIMLDDEDLTNNYALTINDGLLVVNKRKITVYTMDCRYVYSGYNYRGDFYFTGDDLVGNDGVDFQNMKFSSITDVGSVKNVISDFKIKDYSKNIDHTNNYDITIVNSGNITITPREITLDTGTKTWNYDGNEHYYKDYKILSTLGIVPGETFSYKYKTISLVSTVSNTFGDFKVTKANGSDSTKNYKFTVRDTGSISITRRKIYVKLIDEMYEYTGKTYYAETITILYGCLINGDNFSGCSVSNNRRSSVGISTTYVNDIHIRNVLGDDVTNCYEIITLPGELQIYNRGAIIFDFNDLVFEYSGNIMKQYARCISNNLDSTLFISGYSWTDTNNRRTGLHVLKLIDVDVRDRTTNAHVELANAVYRSGSSYVLERKITITSLSITIKADNYKPYLNKYWISSNSLVQNEILSLDLPTVFFKGLNVNKIRNIKIKNEYKTEDVTYCYDIDLNEGVVTIT